MKGIYKYKVLKEQKLIIAFHKNIVTIKELKLVRALIMNDKDVDPSFKILIDLRSAKFDITIEEMSNYGKWLSKNTELKQSSPKIILTNTPNQVVYSTIFSRTMGINEFGYSVYSSLYDSLVFLQIDKKDFKIVKEQLERIIED